MRELYDTKYVYAFFDNVPAQGDLKKFNLIFHKKPGNRGSRAIFVGPKDEDLEQKEKDVLMLSSNK